MALDTMKLAPANLGLNPDSEC